MRFHDFLFKSVQILTLTCYCFFSAGPTTGPDGAGARALKLILIYIRGGEKQRGEMEGEGEEGVNAEDEDTDEGTGALFCSYLCIIPFLLFCFSISQVSSASSPPPPVQAGKGLPLNDFSWASPSLMLLGPWL